MVLICRICSSRDLTVINKVKSPHTHHYYKLYVCNNCRSRLFDTDEYPVNLKELYNDLSKKEVYISTDFYVSDYWKHEVMLIKETFGSIPKSVLDVGCRTGDFLIHWPQDIERIGVELSSLYAEIAIRRGLHIIQNNLEDIEFKRKFDVVTCYAILEHLKYPMGFIKKLTCIINDNGLVVIMIPSFQTLKAMLLELLHIRWHMYCPPEHYNFFSRDYIDGYLKSHGLFLTKRIYTSGGMFNPLTHIPVFRSIWTRLMWVIDTYTYLNRLPIFDHMYSYYVKHT